MDDMDFHCADLINLQQFKDADITHLYIILLYKLPPATYNPFDFRATAKMYFPRLAKSLKTYASLLITHICLDIMLGESLVTELGES